MVVGAFNQEKALVGAFSVITNLRMELFEALISTNCVRMLQAIWDWVILFLVIYTAIFTPYVAAFLLNEPGYSDRSSESYGSDPIVIIDLIGDTSCTIHLLAWPPAANMTMRRILSFCLNMTI